MSDPVVCSFITKVLCSRGGCLGFAELAREVGLPEQQLKQILEDVGQERYLRQTRNGAAWVLAVSAVRICVRKECSEVGCENLHLCKLNLAGKCRVRACKYSHDIFSEDNRKVLKKHELSGLNEKELHVLLLQNDPFLLPDVCNAYNKGEGNCNQQDNCTRLHICRYFLKGQCRFPRCKRSHCLMEPKALRLLLAEGVDDKMAFNIQTICDCKTAALAGELHACKNHPSKPKLAADQEKSDAGNQRKSILEQSFSMNAFMNIDPTQGSSLKPKPAANQEKSDAENQRKPIFEQSFSMNYFMNIDSNQDHPLKPKPAANQEKSDAENQRKSILEQSFSMNAFMNIDPTQDKRTACFTSSPQNEEKKKIDEICLYYLFQFCKHKNNCNMIHYHLPYRWQIYSVGGWSDLPNGVEIEKAYCDPSVTSLLDLDINFKTMTSSTAPVRRLSTPSSVTKPAKFVMTTKWLWYWKNDMGQWIEYGKQDGKTEGSNLNSDDLENLFLADPDGSIHFQAGSQNYVINFKEMTQRNLMYLTKREVRRRPKFVSSEDVKTKKGYNISL